MRRPILAEVGPRAETTRWVGTHDAGRALHLSDEGVRYLVREGHLACERTPSRRRLFLVHQVLELAAKRARAQLLLVAGGATNAGRGAALRQLPLFRVRLVPAKAHLRNLHRKISDPAAICSASDKPRYVTR